jgi:hypothetical protein
VKTSEGSSLAQKVNKNWLAKEAWLDLGQHSDVAGCLVVLW